MARSLEEHTRALAAYLPNGKTFEAKNILGSNFNQLLRGLAGEMRSAQEHLAVLEAEYFPDNTTLFLDEWERVLGIPDDCFSGTGSAETRRTHILVKLASLGIQTAQDFIDLAALFGVIVSVTPGADTRTPSVFPLTFPFILDGPATDLRFTIFVTFTVPDSSRFPMIFPFTFGSDVVVILECLFNRLKPENCRLIFEQV
jgi:uncharacterized protein YmfQ (DUF2313 family)